MIYSQSPAVRKTRGEEGKDDYLLFLLKFSSSEDLLAYVLAFRVFSRDRVQEREGEKLSGKTDSQISSNELHLALVPPPLLVSPERASLIFST